MLSIRQTIASDEFVRALIEDTAALPTRVKDAKDTLAAAEYEEAMFSGVEDAKQRIKEVEAEAMYMVLNETNGDGKKKYTNDTQREMAVTAMLSKDKEYIDAKNALIAARRQEAELKMKLGKVRNQLGFVIDVSYANKSICALIAGLSHESVILDRLEAIARKEAMIGGITETLTESINKLRGETVNV